MLLKYIGDYSAWSRSCCICIHFCVVRGLKYTYARRPLRPSTGNRTLSNYLYHMLENIHQHLAPIRHFVDIETRQRPLRARNGTFFTSFRFEIKIRLHRRRDSIHNIVEIVTQRCLRGRCYGKFEIYQSLDGQYFYLFCLLHELTSGCTIF